MDLLSHHHRSSGAAHRPFSDMGLFSISRPKTASNALEIPNNASMKTPTYCCKITKSPVGVLKLVANDRGLAAILWENDDPKRVPLGPLAEDKKHPVLLETERQLNEYFAGKRETFSLSFDFVGTEFQKEV